MSGPLDDGESIAGRAENGEGVAQEELFPMGVLKGDRLSLGKIIKSGLPVELTASIGRAEVPLRSADGLPDPSRFGRSAVSHEVHKIEVVAKREDGQLVGWKIRTHFRPTYVEPLGMEDEALDTTFRDYVTLKPDKVGAALDRMKTIAAEMLGAPVA